MKHYKKRICSYSILGTLASLLLFACSAPTIQEELTPTDAFTQTSTEESGITFCNTVIQNETMNMFTNKNVLSGGGVAVGDLNNDGFPDLYFTANQNNNKLYLNKKELQFEDITDKAGVAGNSHWSTGVVIVDINNDGWNDIYVSHAGNYLYEPQKLANELFINNGDANDNGGIPTFIEKANTYGLAGSLRTIQAVFFDYDNDLDVYLVNPPFTFRDAFRC